MRNWVALLALVALIGCATPPEPLRSIACADPATWPNIPKGETQGIIFGPTWSLEQGAEVLVEGSQEHEATVKVTAEAARVVLRFSQPAPGTTVEASGQATCRWLNNLDMAVEFTGLQAGRPVKVAAAGINLTVSREKLPTVKVTGPDGALLTPGAPARVPDGPMQFTLTFDRAMDRQQVEAQIRRTLQATYQGYVFDEVEVHFTWTGSQRLSLRVEQMPQPGYITFPTAGLKAQNGLETVGGVIEVAAAVVPVAWLDPTDRSATPATGRLPDLLAHWGLPEARLSGDGRVLLLPEWLQYQPDGQNRSVVEVRYWLYRPTEDRLILLPGSHWWGEGAYLHPRVLPDGKGAIVSDHATIWHYDGQGQRRMIWHDQGLIHTVAVSPVSGKLAIFLSRPLRGDKEIRLIVIDPAAPSPWETSQTYGVVANVKGLDQEGLRAEWAPDDSELLLTQGWCIAKGKTSRPCDEGTHESWRFALESRQRSAVTTDFTWWTWSPDSQWLLAYEADSRMALYHRDAKEPQVRYTPGNLWHFAEGQNGLFLWREWPFTWMELNGGSRTADQPWKPLGYANGRFLVVPIEQ